jgi:hypothetical protein
MGIKQDLSITLRSRVKAEEEQSFSARVGNEDN